MNNKKKLLDLEYIIILLVTLVFLINIFAAAYAVEDIVWDVLLVVGGAGIFFAGCLLCVKIEQSVGYYECKHCEHRYIPTMKRTLFTFSIGRTRYMRCPVCGKWSWQKKVLTHDYEK